MNTSPATTPPTTGAIPGPWPGDDFPSWISPMLVKELRQGVQSGAFAWTFILLQAAMFVVMTFWVLERSTGSGDSLQTNRMFHGWFWGLFGLAAVFILPFRASGSMAAERAGNTLDLLRLTHLSSTQIVFGKWLAVMAQVLLLSTAVLPYLVLQYFFGGLDIVSDLFSFVALLLAASVMTAASVSTAGQPAWSRAILAVVTFYGMVGFTASGWLPGAAALSPWSTLPALSIVAGLVTAVFLIYAAATIAPPAENHAFRARLLALVAAVLALLATQLFPATSAGFVVAVALPLVAGFAIAELTGDPVELASIHAPFARFGVPGQLAAALFTPGWATAVCFTLVAAAILAFAGATYFPLASRSVGSPLPELVALGVAAILLPLPLMLRFPAGKPRKTVFFLVQCISFVLFLFAVSQFGQSGSPAAAVFKLGVDFLPLPALFQAFVVRGFRADEVVLLPPLLATAIALATIVPRFLRELAATEGRVKAAGRQAARAPREARSPAA